jgi:hypothetical protein
LRRFWAFYNGSRQFAGRLCKLFGTFADRTDFISFAATHCKSAWAFFSLPGLLAALHRLLHVCKASLQRCIDLLQRCKMDLPGKLFSKRRLAWVIVSLQRLYVSLHKALADLHRPFHVSLTPFQCAKYLNQTELQVFSLMARHVSLQPPFAVCSDTLLVYKRLNQGEGPGSFQCSVISFQFLRLLRLFAANDFV